MSLHTTITHLDAEFTRQARRNQPQTRWAATHPALDIDLPELRRQLDDWRSDHGRARFAELVDLARRGDHDAATLATITVLPAIEFYERRSAALRPTARTSTHLHDYDALAGTVWETVVSGQSYKPAHLREDIIRQAWLIPRRRRRTYTPLGEKQLFINATRLAGHTPPCHDDDVASRATLTAALDKLAADGHLTDRGRAVLESIAEDRSGGYYSRGHDRTFAQYRLRLVRPLRTNTSFLTSLTA